MSVKLNSTGGGSVTLDSPSTASNYTVTLPSAAGTLATTTGTGSVFTNPTINGFTGDTSAITIGTTQFVKDTSGNVGIGTASPGAKLEVSISSASVVGKFSHTGSVLNGAVLIGDPNNAANSTSIYFRSTGANSINYASGGYLAFSSTGDGLTERMRLDASGNLGLGVTPSGWISGSRALQILNYSSISEYAAITHITNNGYINSAGNWVYLNTAAAANYYQNAGQHIWRTAPSGTAGNAITFTQAMTLGASGDLVLGDTSGLGARQSVIVNGNTGIGYFRNTATSGLTSDQLQVAVGQAAGTGFFLTRMYTSVTTTPVVGFSVRGDGVIFSNYLAGGATTLSVDASANIIRTPSDRNLKTNDKALSYGLAEVNKMRPIIHEWTPEANMGDGKSIGFIAQEMEEIIPEVVSGNESKSLDYGKLTAVLTAAIKELSAQNNALEARLAQLEAK